VREAIRIATLAVLLNSRVRRQRTGTRARSSSNVQQFLAPWRPRPHRVMAVLAFLRDLTTLLRPRHTPSITGASAP
jgi:hypothetical protein